VFLYINRGMHTKESCKKLIALNFGNMAKENVFQKVKVSDIDPKLFYQILVSEDLQITESPIAQSVLDYITTNRKSLSDPDIISLFSTIRYPLLSTDLLVKFHDYKPYLPQVWTLTLLQRLYNHQQIPIPDHIKKPLENNNLSISRAKSPGIVPIQFYAHANHSASLNVEHTEDGKCIISKTGGDWWQNVVSVEPLSAGSEYTIYFQIENCGGQYIGIGLGNKDYDLENSFLGQRNDGWCLCTSAGHPWDGHIFNGITTNTVVVYAPPDLVRLGATIGMKVDLIAGTAKFFIGDHQLPNAWTNLKGLPIHVIVSMFLPGSKVIVWSE